MQHRLAVDAGGRYTRHLGARLPILLVQASATTFKPAGTVRTLRWLQSANEPSLYERRVLPGYAHLDALVGRRRPRCSRRSPSTRPVQLVTRRRRRQ